MTPRHPVVVLLIFKIVPGRQTDIQADGQTRRDTDTHHDEIDHGFWWQSFCLYLRSFPIDRQVDTRADTHKHTDR